MHTDNDTHMQTWDADRACENSGKGWIKFLKTAEKLLGLKTLDGNEKTDGYSLDFAQRAFECGNSPMEYAETVKLKMADLAEAVRNLHAVIKY